MTSLIDRTVAAHGGLARWNELSTVRAHLLNGGITWALKGQPDTLSDVTVTVDLHRQHTSHSPVGTPGTRSDFSGDHIAITDAEGNVIEERHHPRDSFSAHTLETHWDRLQLAYFAGYAMWTYLTAPFSFTTEGFTTEELGPWKENGETWERLKVTFPESIHTHNAEQVLYIGDDGLLRRHDYEAEIIKGGPAAHYPSEYREFDGIMVPTRRRVHSANPDGSVNEEPLLVSVDLDHVSFS
ncbi:hypothetical protein [Streptomyces sp. NBC_01497]|uniref:hypothetical protein n=1 Tax=Streptomyces sp. NBC_01497 TaxID=2903885 RepID=UPI002E37A111|nr:hypothetical protein [Streptomyces sp. NBC_01497]